MAYEGMEVRTLPCNIEAEQNVLGGLMLAPNDGFEIFGKLTAADFFRNAHGTIFEAIKALHSKRVPVDMITVAERLRTTGLLEEVGGVSEVFGLASNTPSITNLQGYADIVRDLSMRRRVIAMCSELQNSAYRQSGPELAAAMATNVEMLTRQTSGKSKKFNEAVSDAQATITDAGTRRRAGGIVGVSTGIPALDGRTGGLHGPRLIILAARPGAGKTALLNQIGVHAAVKGHPGLICSLEMGADELVIRALSSVSGANVTKISHGYEHEAGLASVAADSLGDIPLWIDTETYSLAGICAQIAAHKFRHGIQWAAVDHIGLVQTEKFNSRNDQLGHITRTLKELCKRLNIPIIGLSQLSRASEIANRLPGLSDLRDSGNIEQDADIALFLHVPPDERAKPVKQIQMGLEKNRGGRVGWMKERFEFDGPTQKFREISS